MFTKGPLTAALLLEGKFTSVFTNRLPRKLLDDDGINFKERSAPTKMIVVSDGDIIRNPISKLENKFFALGYDKYSQKVFGNREFVLNAVNYLCDDSGLLNVRSKNFKIRLLDQAKIDEDRTFWEVLNTLVPLVFILVFAIVFITIRKRRFAQ